MKLAVMQDMESFQQCNGYLQRQRRRAARHDSIALVIFEKSEWCSGGIVSTMGWQLRSAPIR